jgi:hypothetical protein
MQHHCGRCNKSARVVDFLSCRSKPDSVKCVGAAMQQIADWLEKLGMFEYASVLLKTALISRSFAN